MPVIRLDKFLSEMGFGTRNEVKRLVGKGEVTVNDIIVRKPEYKADTQKDIICVKNIPVSYVEYEYYMLNKPAGVLSAARDKKVSTVVDLIKTKVRDDLFPLGRLDKDTEGLIIITNDGDMTHKLLSPRYHIPKTYYAKVSGVLNEDSVMRFKEGITLPDGTKLMSADLRILSVYDNSCEIELTIYEGKFHQVKRMVETEGGKVVYLKRLSMGELKLDNTLSLGEYRKLTQDELDILKGAYNNG